MSCLANDKNVVYTDSGQILFCGFVDWVYTKVGYEMTITMVPILTWLKLCFFATLAMDMIYKGMHITLDENPNKFGSVLYIVNKWVEMCGLFGYNLLDRHDVF